MDCNKLPFGHDAHVLYMYKHPNAVKHIQNIYQNEYTVNPKTIIKPSVPHEKIIAYN